MKKELFFDLDRTLWDFDNNSKAALDQIFDQEGLAEILKTSFVEFHPRYVEINEKCWAHYRSGDLTKEVLRYTRFEQTLNHYRVDDHALAVRLGELYVQISPYQKLLVPGTLDLLNWCKDQGFSMHVITNGFSEIQSIKLENSGIAHYFDQVITSEAVGHRKPHPAVFQHAMDLRGLEPSQCIIIGDDFGADIEGGIAANWECIFFNPRGEKHPQGNYKEIDNLKDTIGLLSVEAESQTP
ncbi:MAG: noncanonical pyrimidine nucleotidase, YjjG family [Flavobacteriales bacterium]|nr:noncanonical pyrimidine nucleotidase, YjjG family [Flavobacteriales bacterium]